MFKLLQFGGFWKIFSFLAEILGIYIWQIFGEIFLFFKFKKIYK